MYEHRCANIGADSCRDVFRAETMTALLKMVAEHATQRHNVKAPTTTLMSYVARMAKQVRPGSTGQPGITGYAGRRT